MRKFSINSNKFFGKLNEEQKAKFRGHFTSYVKNYAPEYEEQKSDAGEIKMSEVWKYMDGDFSYVTTSENVVLEELACNMADELKDRVATA